MHRTTTTAALLVTVAVSALTGCVTVQRPATPAPPPDTVPSQPTAPRPDGSAEPRVVEAPAQEALEMAGPSHRPRHTEPDAPHRETSAPHRPPAPTTTPRSPHSEHQGRSGHPDQAGEQHVDIPGVTRPAPKEPDVCALGRQFGGWSKDSPEAVICERQYGR
ncbi:hypothetical protein [Streptomyces sp. NPDC002520]